MNASQWWSSHKLVFSTSAFCHAQVIVFPQITKCQFVTTMVYQAAIKDAEKLRKGPWLDEEDKQLIAIVALSGQKKWDSIARASGLKRTGKSCRLRWLNYLRPNLKQDPISLAEEQIILQLHEQWGNKWSRIARRLPGRTDNEIKNYWRTHLSKKVQSQTQGHFSSFMDKAGEMVQKCEPDARLLSYQYLNSTADIWATTENDYVNFLGSSSFATENSPFKFPTSDWISEFSDDHQGRFEQDCIGSVSTNLRWTIVDDDETCTWGCYLDSLWDPN